LNTVPKKQNYPNPTKWKEPIFWRKGKKKKVALAGSKVGGSIVGNLIFPGLGGAIGGGVVGWLFGSEDDKEKKMAKIPVFYSFHFNNDVMRVQQIRNIGAIEGNPPTDPNQ